MMSPLTTTLLLAFASTVAAKGAKIKGSFSGSSANFDVDWLVPVSTGITIIGILIYFFTYFKLKKTAPMFWCIILIFASQMINFFTGLSTAVESFGEKLPVTWGIADAFATFFMMAGNILVFITVHRAIYDEKTLKLPIRIAIWVWQFAMWFGAGYIWGMVVRYSLAWKDLHGFLVKHGNDKESSLLDKEYNELWTTYMNWNWRMRRSIIGVNGAFLAMCICLLILTLVRRKVLTKKEKTHFPGFVLSGRLASLTATVALQASFLWKEGARSSKGLTIAVWIIVTWNWLLTLGGYCSIIKSYNEILNPKTDFSWKSADDEEARESLTGERGGQTYPQGSNAVAGGDYGYAPMTAPYPTYAPADTQYSRHSYEAPLAPKEGFGKKDKKNKDKAPELVGKATLDRIRDIVPK